MIFLVLTWEKWMSDVELVQDAAEGPHVNGRRVRDTEHDLRRTVEATLDVCVDFLVLEAPRTKVDDLDARLVDLAEENIFRFQIAVHDVVLPHVVQRYQYLDCEALNQAQAEAQEVVHLDEVVEVDAEQLEGQDEVLAEDEVIQPLHNVFLVFGVVPVQRFN